MMSNHPRLPTHTIDGEKITYLVKVGDATGIKTRKGKGMKKENKWLGDSVVAKGGRRAQTSSPTSSESSPDLDAEDTASGEMSEADFDVKRDDRLRSFLKEAKKKATRNAYKRMQRVWKGFWRVCNDSGVQGDAFFHRKKREEKGKRLVYVSTKPHVKNRSICVKFLWDGVFVVCGCALRAQYIFMRPFCAPRCASIMMYRF
jgi:hypothetical protein